MSEFEILHDNFFVDCGIQYYHPEKFPSGFQSYYVNIDKREQLYVYIGYLHVQAGDTPTFTDSMCMEHNCVFTYK